MVVEYSDLEDFEKLDSSDSEYISDDEQKFKNELEDIEDKEGCWMDKELFVVKKKFKFINLVEIKEELKSILLVSEKIDFGVVKDKVSFEFEKDFFEKVKFLFYFIKDKLKGKDEMDFLIVYLGLDFDLESEFVIDLGEDYFGWEG